MRIIVYVTVFLLFGITSKSDTCTSISDGGWDQPEIWSCGHPPGCGDTIYIDHFVEITSTTDYSGCGQPMFIVVNAGGTLNFDSGRKLKLPCGSGVTILPGGAMTSDGGGASESLQICAVTVWQGSDGDVPGFAVFGSGLPIELVSFNAYRTDDVVNIVWTTATETDNDYFTIERGSNGYEFYPYIITDGAGNSNVQISYFETDYSPQEGTNYYRLKQTDFDGNFSYSPTVAVKAYGEEGLQVYPNPTDQNFQVLLNGFDDEEVLLVVSDITGKETYSQKIIALSNHHIDAINISDKLAAGTYIVTVSTTSESYTQKLVIR